MSLAQTLGTLFATARKPAMSTEMAMVRQSALGGGLEGVRDRIVRDVRHGRSLQLTGQRAQKKNLLEQAGVQKAASAKRSR